MSIKLVDSAVPMNESGYPVARAKHIWFDDNATLQDKLDNKELGGGDNSTTLTQEEYEALPEEERLNGLYYTYDTKRIYKNGVQYGASEPIPLTMEEYKALKEAGAIDEKQEYLIEAGAEGILLGAEDIGYDNAESGIQATTVQGAIDEVVEKVNSKTEIDDTTSSTTSTYSSVKINEEIDKNAIENQIENALNCIDITNHALRLAIVSKDYKTLVFRGKTYNCYDSIAVAINTEYELITSAYQLGLAVIIMEGTYTECIRLYGKENISIVGVNKYKCKIVNKETDTENGYYYPPLWINPSTTVMNLTIQCLTSRNIRDAYCIHTDDDGTGKVFIKNCILHCSQHACIGFGTRQDAPLFIEDCDMINDYYNAKGVLLYGHNACSQNTTREEVHVTRCYGRTAMGYPLDFFNANWYYPTGTRGSLPWLLYFNDNTFYQRNNEIPTTITVSTEYTEESEDKINFISGGMMRMPSNSGNNIETLNYPYQNVIENVPPVNIEFNTDYFTTIDSSVSKYEVRNGICYVTMDVTGVASGGGQTVCKLPKPSIPQMQFSIPPYNDASAACVGAILYNNGNLTTFSVRAGQRYMCSFSYPIV